MKKRKNKLPEFSSLKDLIDFWEEEDLTKYEDDFVEVSDLKINIKERMYLPVTIQMYEKLDSIASAKGIKVEELICQILKEKLSELA
jgi:hypothetical protein